MFEAKIECSSTDIRINTEHQIARQRTRKIQSFSNSVCLLTGVLVSLLVGCGDQVGKAKMEAAEKMVRQGLEKWKAGADIKSTRSMDVPIEFYDDDWEASAKLINFEILNVFMESDGTARCSVSLKVQYEDQEPKDVQCAYQIVDDPKIKIARDPMS